MHDQKKLSAHKTLRKRRRPPLSIAVVEEPRRRFMPVVLMMFALLAIGVWGVVAVAESHSTELRLAAAPAPQMPAFSAAPENRALPLDVIPDGRPLGSSSRRKPRRGSRRNDKLEREREERRRKTEEEIDRLHAEYWKEAGGKKSWPQGTAYARFSTRFQESIADQIRKILEFALANEIRVPRHLIFCDLGVRGVKNRRAGLDDVRATLRTRKATVLLLFATNRLFRKTYRTLEFVDTVHKQLQARCIFVMTGIDEEDACPCNRCEARVCGDCLCCCGSCGDGYCSNCIDRCYRCEEPTCDGCLAPCQHCCRNVCESCREDDLCETCREELEEEQNEDESETPPVEAQGTSAEPAV